MGNVMSRGRSLRFRSNEFGFSSPKNAIDTLFTSPSLIHISPAKRVFPVR